MKLLKPDITDRPLERRDYQIQITRHELKTRKADVTITWGNNLKVEGLYVASRVRGGVRLSVPVYFVPGGGRMDLITVGQQLQAAVLRAYQQMEHEGKDQCRVSYLADRAAFQVQTKSVAEGTVIGYADMQAGQDLKVHQIRIRRGSDGRLSCMYPAQASGSNENKQWHNLAAELSDGRLHEENSEGVSSGASEGGWYAVFFSTTSCQTETGGTGRRGRLGAIRNVSDSDTKERMRYGRRIQTKNRSKADVGSADGILCSDIVFCRIICPGTENSRKNWNLLDSGRILRNSTHCGQIIRRRYPERSWQSRNRKNVHRSMI